MPRLRGFGARLARIRRMLGRVGSGATVAGLPWAAAIVAAVQGYWIPAVVFGAATGVILLLTFAPQLPWLHTLPPPLGAPKVGFEFGQVVVDPTLYGRSILLEVYVKPTTRLEDAVVKFEFPSTLSPDLTEVTWVDPARKDPQRGVFLPIEEDTVSPIRWWECPVDLRVSPEPFYFALDPGSRKPQTFRVAIVVASEKLWKEEARKDFDVVWP